MLNRPRIALLLWCLTLALVLVTSYLVVTNGAEDIGVAPESPIQRWVQLTTAVIAVSAGTIIVSRHPKNVIGWLFVAMGMASALVEAGISYAATCGTVASCNLIVLIAFDAIWFPSLTVGLGGLFVLFPDGRVPPGWRRLLWWSLVATGVGGAAVSFVQQEVYLMAGARNPLAGGFDADAVTAISDTLGMLVVVVSLVAVIDFVVRARRATGVARLQNRWLAFSGLLVVLAAIMSIVGQEFGVDLGWAWSLAVATIPVAVAFAVTRNHLYDIDRIVARTVTYSLVVGVLAALVAGVATVAGAQFREPWVVAATTLAVATIFNPLRKRLHSQVDRRFNRSRYDAAQVMDEFAGSLRRRVDTEDVVGGWVDVIEETMQPAAVGVWVRS
jgi:hypothetical protein